LDAPEVSLDVVHCEVDVVRIRLGVPGVAVGSRIEACEDDAAAPEVMPAGRDPHPRLFQHGGVINCGFFNTRHRKNHAE
jgi:hypothetical protein